MQHSKQRFDDFCELNFESATEPRTWNGAFPILETRVNNLRLAFIDWVIESGRRDYEKSDEVFKAMLPEYVDFKTYEAKLDSLVDAFLEESEGDYCLVLHPSAWSSSLHSSVLVWKKIRDHVSSVAVADESVSVRSEQRFLFITGHDLNAAEASVVEEWTQGGSLTVICPYSSGEHARIESTVYSTTANIGAIEDKIEDISYYDEVLKGNGYTFGVRSGLYYFDHHLAAPGISGLHATIKFKWIGVDEIYEIEFGPLLQMTWNAESNLKYLNYMQHRGYLVRDDEGLKAITGSLDIFTQKLRE